MKKYIVYFSICYAAAMALIAIIVSFFDLSGGTSAACLIAAGFATAMKFVQDQRRPPDLGMPFRFDRDQYHCFCHVTAHFLQDF